MSNDQKYWNFIFSILFVLLAGMAVNALKDGGRLPTSIGDIAAMDIFLISLSAFRLIRLLVYDTVMNFVRDYFNGFPSGPRKTVANLLSCPWCTGIWISLIVTFFYFYSQITFFPVLVLAFAGLGSFMQVVINRVNR